ncbi:MAG: efflux RND transporter permease subunit [bacterium]|nr:efflux RND transporter permease subunit [bacterium]
MKYDITVPEIIEKIKLNNLNVGAQFIEQNSEEYVIRSLGLATNINDLSVIVLKSIDGVPVFLKDVAEIKPVEQYEEACKPETELKKVVSGQVIKLFGTNSSYVIENVENKLAEINEILPEGVKIIPYYDQKSLVEACINTIMNALKPAYFW